MVLVVAVVGAGVEVGVVGLFSRDNVRRLLLLLLLEDGVWGVVGEEEGGRGDSDEEVGKAEDARLDLAEAEAAVEEEEEESNCCSR